MTATKEITVKVLDDGTAEVGIASDGHITFYRIAPGHKLRIQLSTKYAPSSHETIFDVDSRQS